MPAYFFVLLSNWPVLPIAFMDLVGVGLGIILYLRRRDWPPLLVVGAFGVRAVSSITRLVFYLAGFLAASNPYYSGGYGYGYDPVTGATLQQTMNCFVALGSVLALAALQTAIWFGFTRRPGEPVPE